MYLHGLRVCVGHVQEAGSVMEAALRLQFTALWNPVLESGPSEEDGAKGGQ